MKGDTTDRLFDRFGGRFVTEALWTPLEEVGEAFEKARDDAAFEESFEQLLDRRLGRPTPLTLLNRLTESLDGGRLWLKREDLCATGNFTGTLAVGYGLMAERMGRTELIGETATGDFGCALASVGNALGLETRVFMGREDREREPMMVSRMEHLGADIETVDTNLRGRKAACAEALRFWATHSSSAVYCASSLASPDPYPRMIAHFLSVIGAECERQIDDEVGEPEYVIAPVGSGGFAAGMFSKFIDHQDVQLVGVEGAGEGLEGRHAASVVGGRPGVYHGTHSYLLQDGDGQVVSPASIAGGLSVPNVGPQHASWAERGRVHYVSVTDEEALEGVETLLEHEGLLVSLEAGHALAYALKLLPTLGGGQDVVVGISGGGLREMGRLEAYELEGED
ncbi:MAG: pyridoxal-phosphate dependent enzyme [Persicimonas sp.]